ncbi:MAG: glycosyltransferase family 4 protein [Bacteroidales bacterium]|nr:glycosyltransferase family 4 protein [Bacteroidales bacterium]
MIIAVNTRLLIPGRLDGIGWFTCETMRRIVAAHPEHEFLFLFDRTPDPQFLFAPNVHPIVLHPKARHPLLWHIYFQWSVPRVIRKSGADLFVSPDGWMPLNIKIPVLDVIHDLNFEHSGNFLRPSHQRYMTHFFPLFSQRATRLATVSEFSKNDIVATYNVDSDKIDVVYNGSHDYYRPCSETEKQKVRQKYCNGNRFFISIGTISRRKNLANIILAYDTFRQSHPGDSTHFVVVGGRYGTYQELDSALDSCRWRSDIHFVGHVESAVLSRLLASAEALVYASLFEGFGIPILEAFYAEVPVVSSEVTSMPEVAGDAALLVNPESVDAIAHAMSKIVGDRNLCDELVSRGRRRRELFTWDITASRLWQSMMATVGSNGNSQSSS